MTYAYGSAGSNNGQISSITDYMDNGRTITYTYDSLYRMTKAVTNGSTNYPAWGLQETYDRYGNRSAQAILSHHSQITAPFIPRSSTIRASSLAGTTPPQAPHSSGTAPLNARLRQPQEPSST